ncbi:hypothetical protein LINGRAPRIM_LOCUS539 [Linum grandiflorum]
MEIVDTPNMELVELQESKAAQKISVVDHINGFQYTPETPDNFVIDMEDFSTTTTTTTTGKESYANSRITLQRSLSRKGFIRGGGGGDKKGSNSKEKYSVVAGSSPRGGSMPEMGTKTTTTVAHSANSNGQGHHQITITSAASNIKATTTVDGRCAVRRNSFKRSQASWLLDPRKVLFFFATLSSIGTLLLICFTLSIVQSDDAAVLE